MQPRPYCAENDHTSNSVNCIANIRSIVFTTVPDNVNSPANDLLEKERFMYHYIVMCSVIRSKLDVQLRGQQIVC